MGSIYRPTRKLPDGRRVPYKTYRISYLDPAGKRISKKAFRDKDASKAMLRRCELEVERRKAGLITGSTDKQQQPISELAALYLAELRRQGRSAKHLHDQKLLLDALCSACAFNTLANIRADAVTDFLANLQKDGRSARTLNAYRGALLAFLEWCRLPPNRWIEHNPLDGYKKAKDPDGKKPRRRRAFTPEEFACLLIHAGRHRDLYFVAGLSGLRRRELSLLEVQDVSFKTTPTWQLRPEIQKGRRSERLPIVPELLATLSKLMRAANLKGKLFRTMPTNRTFDAALKRAGIQKIDDQGRRLDFHSLRYFFCTMLGQRLPIQLVRLLMRHRDITTTCNLYMQLGLSDLNEAMPTLPKLLPSPQASTPQAPFRQQAPPIDADLSKEDAP